MKKKNVMEINIKGMSSALVYALVFARDKKCCYKGLHGKKCNIKSRLEIHHIVGRANNGSNDPENLIALCARHHKILHSHKGKRQILLAKKLIIDSAVSMSAIAPLIGFSQPTLSQMLQKTPTILKRIIHFKNLLNSILKTSYSIEELFENITLPKRYLLHNGYKAE